MRTLGVLTVLATLASGCLGDSTGGDGDGDGGDRPGYRDGVVVLNEPYAVSSVQPATFPVQVEAGARDLILEIQMDSGVMPNVRVELTGCGQVDPSSSGAWEGYPLCDRPTAGQQTLRVTVRGAVAGTGTGRLLLRADLPSP